MLHRNWTETTVVAVPFCAYDRLLSRPLSHGILLYLRQKKAKNKRQKM